jgi:DNA-binding IclR family transcriptional regulator
MISACWRIRSVRVVTRDNDVVAQIEARLAEFS